MDYYCFPTKTSDLSVFFNLEQYTTPEEKFFYQTTQEDVMLAQKKGKLLLFDIKNQTFLNSNGDLVNIKGKEIFPRCKIQESEQLLNAIESNGGKSIVTFADSKKIENWFKYVDVQRKFIQTTFGEVQKNLDAYENKFGKKFFLKTIEKHFSSVCFIMQFENSKELCAVVSHILLAGSMLISDNSTPVLVTNAVSIITDDYGKREWRVFVVKNKIWCISRISDDLVEVETYVIEKIQKRIIQLSEISSFPSSYCVDFFEYEDNGNTFFDICEFNPIQSSGTYRNNDLVF